MTRCRRSRPRAPPGPGYRTDDEPGPDGPGSRPLPLDPARPGGGAGHIMESPDFARELEPQSPEIEILRPFASAAFGIETVSTPFENEALTSSALTVRGRLKDLRNEP